MSVGGDVIQFPDLGRTSRRVFGDGRPPFEVSPSADACTGIPFNGAELGFGRRVVELASEVGHGPREMAVRDASLIFARPSDRMIFYASLNV